jgi:hypothetical protein
VKIFHRGGAKAQRRTAKKSLKEIPGGFLRVFRALAFLRSRMT